VHPPDGAFYLFPDFSPLKERLAKRGIYDSAGLCDQLLADTGVAILPGMAFERPAEELTARLAYVDFDGARVLSASETIPLDQPLPEKFLTTHCGRVLEAMDRIADWLNA
jgi:aspartate aminotransferase